jgi:hypothetical protein
MKIFRNLTVIALLALFLSACAEKATGPVDNINLKEFRNLSISFKNLHILYYERYVARYKYNDGSYFDTTYEKFDYYTSWNNKTEMALSDSGNNRYNLFSPRSDLGVFDFEIDTKNKLIKNIKFYSQYITSRDIYILETTDLIFEIKELPYSIINDSLLLISGIGRTLNSISMKIKSSYNFTYNKSRFDYLIKIQEITKLLEFTDSSQVIISIYRK